MIKIEEKPIKEEIIRHYNVRIDLYKDGECIYNQILTHNETTGEIDIDRYGMSLAVYRGCIEPIREKFKKQMGLNQEGKKII